MGFVSGFLVYGYVVFLQVVNHFWRDGFGRRVFMPTFDQAAYHGNDRVSADSASNMIEPPFRVVGSHSVKRMGRRGTGSMSAQKREDRLSRGGWANWQW